MLGIKVILVFILLMPEAKKKLTIAILVPCYNEEKTIEKCVLSWINQTRPADKILVVNDFSRDGTLKILNKYKNKISIINLRKNTGNKSYVQQKGLKRIDTDVFIATDADTLMDPNFVARVELAFQDENLHAFAGYIKSLQQNWLTACREVDYIIGQDIHKTAQNLMGFLFVIPGCAGAFRTEVFKKEIGFDHDTLTEDLDFTYKINKKKIRIVYDKKAVVYTQDPSTLKSYVNQMRRWYSGGWQNLVKHKDMLKRPTSALELSMTYIEGLLFYPLMFVIPIVSITAFAYLLLFSELTWLAFGLYAGIRRRRLDLFIFSQAYVLISYINAYIFLEQFVKVVLLKKKNLTWFHPERREII